MGQTVRCVIYSWNRMCRGLIVALSIGWPGSHTAREGRWSEDNQLCPEPVGELLL